MYLPAEVCHVIPGQPSNAKLDGSQTQQMIRYAVRKPWDNARAIQNEGIATVGLDANTNLLLVRIDCHISSTRLTPHSAHSGSKSVQGLSKSPVAS